MSITDGFFNLKRAMQLLALMVIAATVLAAAPASGAYYTFQVTYSNRTATSVKVNWTMRPQEDAPHKASDVVRVCWTTSPTAYPCTSNEVFMYQYGSPNQWNSYTITGLNCSTTYRVLVAQSYIYNYPSTPTSGDWHSVDPITVPATCGIY